jgi:hypothetical protein
MYLKGEGRMGELPDAKTLLLVVVKNYQVGNKREGTVQQVQKRETNMKRNIFLKKTKTQGNTPPPMR